MGNELYSRNELVAIRTKAIALKAAGAITSSSDTKTSDPIKVTQFTEANFFLDVTAVAGTPSPTLIVVIYTKDPISGRWYTLQTFTTVTGVTTQMLSSAANIGGYLAVGWTKGGDCTGATFSVGAVLKA
jgi:hypothetical protein